MDFPFHGIPTVPPRKDMMHLVSGKKRERERKNRERERKNREREKKQRERETERERTEDNSLEKRGGKKTLSPSRLSSAGAAAIASPPSPRGPPRLSSAPSGQAGSRGPIGRTAGGARPG